MAVLCHVGADGINLDRGHQTGNDEVDRDDLIALRANDPKAPHRH